MMNTDLQTCLDWNAQGFIPGPNETEAEFLARVDYCLHLKERLHQELELPQEAVFSHNSTLITSAFSVTKTHYDIAPQWVPILFSNDRLAPWHGGVAWIFQLTDHTPTAAFIQLRTAFAHRERYLGLYSRTEIVAHECSHVGRMLFEEPKFEELIAYSSSPSRLRRLFGPIIQSAWEGILFLALLFLNVLIDVSTIANYQPHAAVYGLKWLPWIWLSCGLVRLWLRHRQFNACWQQLNNLFQNPDTAHAVIYRLTDDEIIAFGHLSPKQIQEYAQDQAKHSFRWKWIHMVYCHPSPPSH